MSPDPKVASRPITPDACWKVLEGAAASDHLKRATRLKEFLYYVGKKSIKEGFSDIHEQEIGQAVFGRKDSYDTSQDNIVRVSATELRRRVDAYFAEEGKGEPLVFEIPRGSYTPIFRWRAEMPLANTGKAFEAGSATGLPAAHKPSWRTQLPLLIVSAAAIVLAVACVTLWRENRSLHKMVYTWDGQPALAAILAALPGFDAGHRHRSCGHVVCHRRRHDEAVVSADRLPESQLHEPGAHVFSLHCRQQGRQFHRIRIDCGQEQREFRRFPGSAADRGARSWFDQRPCFLCARVYRRFSEARQCDPHRQPEIESLGRSLH